MPTSATVDKQNYYPQRTATLVRRAYCQRDSGTLKLIRGLYNIRESQRGCVATIGNFDGAHLGHQHLIGLIRETARQQSAPSCLISFEPLPAEVFAPATAPPLRLTALREKYRALAGQQLDQLLLLQFNRQLASTDAEAFIEEVLINGLQVKHLLVGDDFKFGRNRQGNFELLQSAAEQYGFSLQRAPTFPSGGERISSTRIRRLLQAGDLLQAGELLGRPYALQGRVVYGAQLGRQIGFPTANIQLANPNPPLRGVFAVTVELANDRAVAGIANLGSKPTVDGTRISLEVHLLDFAGDLYGQRLRVEFLHQLRSEKKFDSIDQLTRAIKDDERTARQWFSAQR